MAVSEKCYFACVNINDARRELLEFGSAWTQAKLHPDLKGKGLHKRFGPTHLDFVVLHDDHECDALDNVIAAMAEKGLRHATAEELWGFARNRPGNEDAGSLFAMGSYLDNFVGDPDDWGRYVLHARIGEDGSADMTIVDIGEYQRWGGPVTLLTVMESK